MPWQRDSSGFTTKRGGHIANPEQYEKLRAKGMSKQRAAAIVNKGAAMSVEFPLQESAFVEVSKREKKHRLRSLSDKGNFDMKSKGGTWNPKNWQSPGAVSANKGRRGKVTSRAVGRGQLEATAGFAAGGALGAGVGAGLGALARAPKAGAALGGIAGAVGGSHYGLNRGTATSLHNSYKRGDFSEWKKRTGR